MNTSVYIHDKELVSLIKIFECQRLPKSAARHIALTLRRWEQNYGIKWVVGRLKSLKAALLSGDTVGIRTHKDGSFYGAFRPVYQLAQSSRRGAIRADRILRVYGRWEAKKPTTDDYREFADGIAFKGFEYSGPSFLVTRRDHSLARRCQREARFTQALPNSESKIVPFIRKREIEVLPHEHYETLQEMCPRLLLKWKDFFQRYVYRVDVEESASWLEADLVGFYDESLGCVADRVVGQIACLTKDRGLKKRFIANPHRFLQMATSRLQDACARYLRALPESFVYDQDQSVDWIVDQLKDGKRLFSLDLSSATDHFPLTPQVELLKELFPKLDADINLWSDICQGQWTDPSGEVLVEYGKGQPMGTAPSFAAFTLSHIHAVRTVGGNDSNFRVIGDDIVISCPKLAEAYQDLMRELGVEISLMKSLLDDDKAEFAGRIIDIHGLWPVYKASPMSIAADPLGCVRQYGMAGLSLVSAKLRDKIEFAARIPLLGVPHAQDFRVLDEIRDVDLDLLYSDKYEPYHPTRRRPSDSVWLTKVSRFEAAQQNVVGFLGAIGVENHPNVVEHVNSNLADGNNTTVIVELESMLQKGTPIPFWDEDRKGSKPISWIKALYKLKVHNLEQTLEA